MPAKEYYDKYVGGGSSNEAQDYGQPLSAALIGKTDALGFLDKRGIFTSGIVCECCQNQCHISELQSYCKKNLF